MPQQQIKMSINKISTGQYIDSEGKTAECVCIPLQNKQTESIMIKSNRIYVNYEKVYYNEEGEIIPEETQPFAYQINDDEAGEILNSILINGSSIHSAMESKIVATIKKMQNIG